MGKGLGTFKKQGSRGSRGRINNQCPMPNAQCPMPHAQCPTPQLNNHPQKLVTI
ncbi:hypothetical protein [Nostoc sp.]|uniref:hypothetical protein n=1 Tax=Nostoc sp. TaxID=1180 RepID=UPI002FFCE26A